MSHGLDNTVRVLERWAAIAPNQPMPSDWREFARKNIHEASWITENDPELVSLLDGSAPAGLRVAALKGTLAPKGPDRAAERQQQERQQLFDAQERVKAGQGSFTDLLLSEVHGQQSGAHQPELPGFGTGPMAEARRQAWEMDQQRQQQAHFATGGHR